MSAPDVSLESCPDKPDTYCKEQRDHKGRVVYFEACNAHQMMRIATPAHNVPLFKQ